MITSTVVARRTRWDTLVWEGRFCSPYSLFAVLGEIGGSGAEPPRKNRVFHWKVKKNLLKPNVWKLLGLFAVLVVRRTRWAYKNWTSCSPYSVPSTASNYCNGYMKTITDSYQSVGHLKRFETNSVDFWDFRQSHDPCGHSYFNLLPTEDRCWISIDIINNNASARMLAQLPWHCT